MGKYRYGAAAIASVSAVAVLSLAAGATAVPGHSTARRSTIASAATVDYRVVVQATRTSNGAAPTAAVTVAVSARSGGHWLPATTHRLPETYFWKVVTAPQAVCTFTLSTRSPSPHLTIGLLETPSIGCAPTRSISLPAS